MCKLNVYMIDKFVPGIDVKEIFNHHHHKSFENINDEIEIKKYDEQYNYYEASAGRCDCGSIVGMLSDYSDKFDSYLDYLNSVGKENIVELYKIKEHLLDENYDEKLNNVLKTRDKMFSKLEAYTSRLKELEAKMSEIDLNQKQNLQGQILIKQLKKEISELKESLSKNEEYKMLELSYNDFIKRNESLIASRNYTLQNKKDWWQANIDNKINMLEHENHMHVNAEFNHLKFVLGDILKLTGEVKVFSFWQDEDTDYDNLEEKKVVSLKDLKIDDLVFLNFKEVITILK